MSSATGSWVVWAWRLVLDHLRRLNEEGVVGAVGLEAHAFGGELVLEVGVLRGTHEVVPLTVELGLGFLVG